MVPPFYILVLFLYILSLFLSPRNIIVYIVAVYLELPKSLKFLCSSFLPKSQAFRDWSLHSAWNISFKIPHSEKILEAKVSSLFLIFYFSLWNNFKTFLFWSNFWFIKELQRYPESFHMSFIRLWGKTQGWRVLLIASYQGMRDIAILPSWRC